MGISLTIGGTPDHHSPEKDQIIPDTRQSGNSNVRLRWTRKSKAEEVCSKYRFGSSQFIQRYVNCCIASFDATILQETINYFLRILLHVM